MLYCNKQYVQRTLWTLLLGCLMTAVSAMAGVDVLVNPNILPVQNEPSITLNQAYALPGNVVVGYNYSPGTGFGIGIGYSFDYGATWNNTNMGMAWGNEGNPSLASDLYGNVFAGLLSFGNPTGPIWPPFWPSIPNNGVYVGSSSDGGMTWSPTTPVDQYAAGSTPAYLTDREYLATDTYPGSLFANNLYVVWQRDHSNGINSDIYFAWSNDQAASFHYATGTPTGRISDLPSTPGSPPVQSSLANGAMPAVAPDGTIYVAWLDAPVYIPSAGFIYVDKSTDGGQTWGPDVQAAACYNVFIRKYWGDSPFRVQSFPSIAVSPRLNNQGYYDVYVVYAEDPDRQNEISIESDMPGASISQTPQIAYDHQYVYAVWVDGRNSASNGDIYFNRSTDNGTNWGTDMRLNTGTAAGSAFVQTPRIYADSTGNVYVVWEDRRNGKPDIYFKSSSDNGTTWNTEVRLDTGTPAGADSSWAPEITAAVLEVYVVWTDNRNGDSDVLFNYSGDNGVTWLSSALRIDHAMAGAESHDPKIRCFSNSVFVSWWDMDGGNENVLFNSSFDGGASWQPTDVQLAAGFARNPCMCNRNTNIYVGWEDQRNGLQDIYFNCSLDGGLNWQPIDTRLDFMSLPGSSWSGDLDLTCLEDTVYAVWSDAEFGQTDIYYSISIDNGLTWPNPPARIETDPVRGGCASSSPCISVQPGWVYIAFTDYRHGVPEVYFHGWSTSRPANYLFDLRLDTGDPAGLNSSTSPVIGSFENFVYAVWIDSRNGNNDIYFNSSSDHGMKWRDGPDDGDIMLVRSRDGGATFDPPVRVNDDLLAVGQFQPSVKVKPNGIIDVVWYDWRNDPINDQVAEMYMGASNDRGMTFSNWVVSDMVLPVGPLQTSMFTWTWFGKYTAIDVDNAYAYLVWTDTRLNNVDIFFDRFVNPIYSSANGNSSLPDAAYLEQNVPNPFNPVTIISFGLAKRSEVTLRIYDVTGTLVRVLVNEVRPAGRYREKWDGLDGKGEVVSSGVYFYRLQVPGFKETRKMVLLK